MADLEGSAGLHIETLRMHMDTLSRSNGDLSLEGRERDYLALVTDLGAAALYVPEGTYESPEARFCIRPNGKGLVYVGESVEWGTGLTLPVDSATVLRLKDESSAGNHHELFAFVERRFYFPLNKPYERSAVAGHLGAVRLMARHVVSALTGRAAPVEVS